MPFSQTARLLPGKHVCMSDEACYDHPELAQRLYTIVAAYDHRGSDAGGHPDFEPEQARLLGNLYRLEGVETCLYEAELVLVDIQLPQHPRRYQVEQTVYLGAAFETPCKVVSCIDPRLPNSHIPFLPKDDACVMLPWEYVIEGEFSPAFCEWYEHDQHIPAGTWDHHFVVSERLLTTLPPESRPSTLL